MNSVINIYRSASSYVAKQLMKGSSIEDKVEMVKLMQEDLDEQPSTILLFCIDKKGVKKPYDSRYSYEQWDMWAASPHLKSDLSHIQAEMCVAMEHTEKLVDDESPCERAVRGFIEFMTEEYMTNEYEVEGKYDNPMIKSHMDATVIEEFVEEINRKHKGLTREQCDRVNKMVIGSFNERAKRHDTHMDFVLDRALNHGIVVFPEFVDEEAEMEWAVKERQEQDEFLRSTGYHVPQLDARDYLRSIGYNLSDSDDDE